MPNKVYTQYDRPKTIPTNPGDEYLDTFQEAIDEETGDKTIVPTGKTNVYKKIQADLEDSKIENIIHRMMMGDFSDLRKQDPIYADTTTMPKTLMEAQNLMLKARSEFENFPAEVREMFNYSVEQYISEMGTKPFLDKMTKYNDKMTEIEKAGSHKKYLAKVAEQAQFEKDVAAAKGGTNES